MLIIPTRNDLAVQQFRIDLDGTTYVFRFAFNSRTGRWYLDVKDANENDLLTGVILVIGTDLLGLERTNTLLPPGNLFILNLVDVNADIGRDALGTDALILYEEAT